MILDFRYNSLTSFESFEHSHYCLLMIDRISVAVSFSFHIYSSFFSQFSNESTLNSSKNNKKKDSTHANNLIYTETSVDENFTFKIIKLTVFLDKLFRHRTCNHSYQTGLKELFLNLETEDQLLFDSKGNCRYN
jgi:hypothetical protein